MKMLNVALIITLMLISGVALAEKGSGQKNMIVKYEPVTTQLDSGPRADITFREGTRSP
ncbi:hypothetical protein [Halomonas sp. KO116]|uniref:hypothetical protein n=1 Tax=Halomonas sp. KO116 TaxID=1504981 RepID=UPI0004E36420|nr:hypothetical protein [Halomonas sp. KO116]AJY50932.1 hypothetical protein KO116_02457 [Halomonas sp. KO116]|tara:strand:- start:331 stop:507 length:177 start_codon:yes stop_codon:yes gene_type:complete